MIAFRNGDGSTNFSETALKQLNIVLSGFGRSFKLISASNVEMSVIVVSSTTDLRYTNNYSMNGSGVFTQTSARAASLGYALLVQGGEVITLTQVAIEGQNIAYNLFEFKEDGTVNSAGDNNRWREAKTTLHSDTRYITIAFRYADATTVFSDTAVAQLNSCVQKFSNPIELIFASGKGSVIRNGVKNINQMSFFVGYTYQGGGASFIQSTGRAADINNCLQVVGGQIVSLVNPIVEGKDISYAICEFMADGNINPNGEQGRRWLTTDLKLHKDTAYIVIFFKNGDGSTDFTISGASELPNCITLK